MSATNCTPMGWCCWRMPQESAWGTRYLASLLTELDRRVITVFAHPGTLSPEPVQRVPMFSLDYLLETSRTAVDLILSGALEHFPRIRFILAHGGGFAPHPSTEPSWR